MNIVTEIQKYFKGSDVEEVKKLLSTYDGNEIERVKRAILQLSLGSVEGVKYHLNCANENYRDLLNWVENFNEGSDQELGGMTVNERLCFLNLLGDYERAIKEKDVMRLRKILEKCLIGEANIVALIESKNLT